MSAIPWVNGMTARDYRLLDINSPGCSVSTCANSEEKECKKGLCPWKFCGEHFDHLHYGCNYPGCADYGIYVCDMKDYDVAVCLKHTKSIVLQKKCIKAGCRNIAGSSGYCSMCLGGQYDLHKRGIPSLFGPGK